jgi:hypothetical protein
VQSERGNLHIAKFLRSALGKAWVLRDRESDFDTTVHRDDNMSISVEYRFRCINQGAHTNSE